MGYNPDQPRDDHGRFSSGGGGGGGGSKGGKGGGGKKGGNAKLLRATKAERNIKIADSPAYRAMYMRRTAAINAQAKRLHKAPLKATGKAPKNTAAKKVNQKTVTKLLKATFTRPGAFDKYMSRHREFRPL